MKFSTPDNDNDRDTIAATVQLKPRVDGGTIGVTISTVADNYYSSLR